MRVSMKSGLEGRNNSQTLTHDQFMTVMSQ